MPMCIADAGVWVFSGELHASNSAAVLRHQNGDIVLTDGPFTESRGSRDRSIAWRETFAVDARG